MLYVRVNVKLQVVNLFTYYLNIMKSVKSILILIILVLFITSCSKPKLENVFDFETKNFPKNIKILSEKLKLPSEVLKIESFNVIGSFLVINQDRRDLLFSILNISNLEHVKSFGVKGNGPNEFNLAFPNTFKPMYKGNQKMFATGNKMSNVQYYKIEDLISGNETPYKITKLSPSLNGYRAIVYIKDSLIVGAPYGGDTDLFKYSKERGVDKFLKYPNKFPLIKKELKREVYGSYMAANPNNKKFVRTYSNIGRIEIFDLINPTPFIINYKNFPSLKENLKLNTNSKYPNRNKDEKVFSWGIKASKKYIYVSVYNNLYTNVVGKNGPKQSFIPAVHVFDWSGKPIANLTLDNHYINFDVDESGEFLYTESMYEEGNIRRYDLRKILP